MSLILDFLFPKYCYFCHQPHSYLCPVFLKTLTPNSIQTLLEHPEIDFSLSLFRYSGPLKTLLHDLKYNFVYDLVPSISELISSTISQNYPNILNHWRTHQATVIPVPLHSFRHNWRGFNQSELIASKVSQQLKLNFDPFLINRHRLTSSQVSLPHHHLRLQNVANAFSLASTEINQSKNYIVFDDVATTRSTLLSVAQTLKPLNPNSICFLTLAGS